MFKRAKYQQGCLTREQRKKGADVWVFRYRDADGTNRKIQIGNTEKYPNKKSALRACERHRININSESFCPRTMSQLIEHYKQQELSETSSKAYSTRECYKSYLTLWIEPKWGEFPLWEIKTVTIENWLMGLSLANGTKSKIRNLLSALFRHAQKYEWVEQERNPVTLVRQSAKRERIPDVLTVDELKRLLAELAEPFKTMVIVAVVTGLRVSELLALRWGDVDFEKMELHVVRGIVHQVVGDLKTEASQKPLPLDSGLAEVLLDWRAKTAYRSNDSWVFASPTVDGEQPYWPDSVRAKIIQPAAKRAQISKQIGWHTFRRSFGTLLKGSGADVKVVQELMRHANSRVTLDTYVQAVTEQKREAQRKVAEAVLQ